MKDKVVDPNGVCYRGIPLQCIVPNAQLFTVVSQKSVRGWSLPKVVALFHSCMLTATITFEFAEV